MSDEVLLAKLQSPQSLHGLGLALDAASDVIVPALNRLLRVGKIKLIHASICPVYQTVVQVPPHG